jgi:hypothetical protein
MGGKYGRNPPSLKSSKAPPRSTPTLVRDNSRSSRRNPPPSIGFPSLRGWGEEIIATIGCRLSLLFPRLSSPGQLPTVSGTGRPKQYRPYPPLVVYGAKAPPIWAVCFRDNRRTLPEALLSMVVTDEGRGWVGKSDRGSDLKDGTEVLTETIRTWFSRRVPI